MNNLFNLINHWSELLVINLLRFVNVSETSIAAVARAFKDRNAAIDADKKMIVTGAKAGKYLIFIAIPFIIMFIYKIIKKLSK